MHFHFTFFFCSIIICQNVQCIMSYRLCECAQVLSCVQLFVTPWTVARQAPLSMGFPRQEYCTGVPFPSPGDLLRDQTPSLMCPALLGRPFTTSAIWEALWLKTVLINLIQKEKILFYFFIFIFFGGQSFPILFTALSLSPWLTRQHSRVHGGRWQEKPGGLPWEWGWRSGPTGQSVFSEQPWLHGQFFPPRIWVEELSDPWALQAETEKWGWTWRPIAGISREGPGTPRISSGPQRH